MIEITSVQNNLIKEIVKLHQKKYREEFIIVEGKKALLGAVESGLKTKYVFGTDKSLLLEYEDDKSILVNEKVMEKISTTDSAPAILGVLQKPEYNIEDFRDYKKIILLDSIKDAGNLGTIIRTAAAFDIDGIILFGDCTDEFSPKAIRSAAGNIFKVPIVHASIRELKELKKTHKMVSTVVNSKNSIKDFITEEPVITMFGSEANGLCKELLSLSDISYTVPMKEGVESLNLAISAGIVLYEMHKL